MSYKLSRLSEVTSLIKDGTHGTHERVKSGIPLLSAKDIESGHIQISKETPRITNKEYSKIHKNYSIKKDDLLITVVGTLGRCALVTEEQGKFSVQRSVGIIRGDKYLIDSKFLYYVASSSYFYRQLLLRSKSTAQAGVYLGELSQCTVPLPSLPEQKKISEILSCIDKLISLLDIKISKLQFLFNGQRQEFFEGKSNWDEYKISDIADPTTKYSLTGGPFGSDLKVSDYTLTGIRIIQLQNIGDSIFYDENKIYTSLEKADSLLSSNIFAGDLIIAKMGDPVAKCTVIPNYIPRCLMSSDGIRLKVNQNMFDNYFIQLSINSSYFRKKTTEISTGTTRQRIGLQEFRKLTISCPSIKEQIKISRTLLSIQESINGLKQQQVAIKKLKRGLSTNLLLGYKRVNV